MESCISVNFYINLDKRCRARCVVLFVFARSFLRLTKGIVDFRNGVITIYPDLESFCDDSDNSNDSGDDWDAILENVDFVVGFTIILAKFLIIDIPVDKDVPIVKFYVVAVRNKHETNSDDEEDYCVKRDEMGKPIYGPNFSKYLNCDDPIDCTNDFKAGSSRPKRSRQHETVEEAMLPHVHHEFLHWGTSNRAAKFKYNTNLARLLPKQIYKPCIVYWGLLNNMGYAEEIEEMLETKVYEMGGDEELFTSDAWRRVFDINELVYSKLCHEFYATYEFDEIVTDKDLMSKKLIKFRLGGCGHTLTILEFSRRLELYTSDEIHDEGFETYFLRGLRNDDHFNNVNQYWSEISSENEFILSRSSRNEVWLMSMFKAKHQNGYVNIARRANLLTGEVLDGLSAPIYYRPLDTTTLRELIDSNGRLIAEEPAPCDPRVAIPRPPCHSITDLYDKMGHDEPMWASDRVVAPTPGSAITIHKTTNEFAIKGSNNFDTDKIMVRMDAMTMKMDARYKEFQSRSKQPNPDHNDDDIPMSREEEAKLMQTFRRTRFYNDYRDRDSNRDNWRSSRRNDYNQDNYRSNSDDKHDLQKQLSDFIKAQHSTNSFVKDTFMDLKTKLETTTKNHQASIQNLKAKFDRFADKQSARPSRSLPSNTQPNPKGSSSKPYQPPQDRNEHVNVVFTWSGKSYDPPINPNDQQNDIETPINFDSKDEDEESTPQPKSQTPKPVKETPIPKPYKPNISYPQRLRKEKMEAQYGIFLHMIRFVRINVPLVDVLAGMPNYGNFLKELVSNKHKLEQISSAFLSDESSAMIQNKVPPKLGDLESFLNPCNFNKAFSCNALADLDASINLMSIDVIDEILEENFDAFLDEGSEILHSIEGTILEEKLFAEFDEFMAMNIEGNSESESDNKEPPFEKITFNTDYKIKTSLE
ncbi:hypothetical protein Tco_1314103 [Tanacetum coccineum]